MKLVAAPALALVLLALAGAPAEARGAPPGSYLDSCRQIRVQGGALVAMCRKRSGRWVPTSLPNVRRCVGDIGNANGRLVCHYR